MKKHHVADSSHRKAERGSVLAYTVLSVLFLFFAVGLGADLSHLYMVKNELQNSADASALAGASALLLPEDVRISTAVDRAVEIMNRNKYNFNNISMDVDRADLCGAGQACVEFAVNLDGPYMNEAAAAGTAN
ncbi:MAG: TadE/TadG family type IV pilus assembly protein, partial [Pyrinomonadaceae bacterium]